MEQKNKSDRQSESTSSREDRLKAALKANMAKRKAQTKARRRPKSDDSDNES